MLTMAAPFDLSELALRLAGANELDIDAAVNEALAVLAELAGAERSYITLYHDDGTFENTHEWTATGVLPQLPVIQQLKSDDFAFSYQLALNGDVLAAPDLDDLPDEAGAERESFAAFGVRAVLQVPIVVDGEGIGLIGFNHYDVVEPWEPELIEVASRVGQVIAVVLLRLRAIQATRRAHDEAERAGRLKDELLAHVSHEFRNPLHAILGFAELMELDARDERDRRALDQIRSNGRRLLVLVEDLLALAPGATPSIGLVDLGPEVATVVADVEPVARKRSISIDVGSGVTSATIQTEESRLRQVLYCIVSGSVQSLTAGGRLEIDASEPSSFSVHLHDVSDAGHVVIPLARALMSGHGAIEIAHAHGRRATIHVRFEDVTPQVASP